MSDSIFPRVGMSPRETMAAMALQGLLAGKYWSRGTHQEVAEEALRYADALLDAMARNDGGAK